MLAQVLAIVIFLGMFLLIVLDRFERHVVTLSSGALVLVLVFGLCMHSWQAIVTTLNLGELFTSGFWYGASDGGTSGDQLVHDPVRRQHDDYGGGAW